MLSRAGFVVLAFAVTALTPAWAGAADASVGGKGSRVMRPGGMGQHVMRPPVEVQRVLREGGKGPRVMRPDGRFVSMHGRPIFIVDDDFADFGDLQTETAPPLRIEVKGDVEVVPLANGGLRIRFVDE
jgi:hypothetical protein